MKKRFNNVLITPSVFLLLSLLFQGCLKDSCKNTQTFTQWTPVYISDAEMNLPPTYEGARPLVNPGKIYLYGQYLLINELKEGIHVFDNSNLSAPLNIGFIKIVGNVDMTIKDNTLLADSYDDLLTMDISVITAPKLLKRTDAVFPASFFRDPLRGWLVDYKADKLTREIDCTDPRLGGNGFNRGWFMEGDVVFAMDRASANSAFSTTPSVSARPASVGGSMARFTTVGDYLYAVDVSSLKTFSIKQLDNPTLAITNNLGWGIETIFPYKNNLFIGSTSGLFIFNIDVPSAPKYLSNFSHARRCDPVFVDGNTAYVTLNGTGACGGNSSQMDVLDVSNLSVPRLIKTYPMSQPKGLSILDKTLYLCDDGLKVFNIENNTLIDKNLKAHVQGFDAYDVISFVEQTGSRKQNIAMVIGKTGFTQFDVTDPNAPKELSRIPVVRN